MKAKEKKEEEEKKKPFRTAILSKEWISSNITALEGHGRDNSRNSTDYIKIEVGGSRAPSRKKDNTQLCNRGTLPALSI